MEKVLQYLGKHTAYIPEDKERNEPNIGLIIGSEQSLLVDAGSGIAHFERVIETLEAHELECPRQIVLTHYHWDHCFAAGYYESVLYAQNLTAAKLEAMHHWRLDDEHLLQLRQNGDVSNWSEQMIQKYVPGREHLIVKQADIVFNDGLTFALGDVQAQAIHVGGSHTNDSTIVYVPTDKVLFVGDSLYSSRGAYNLEMLKPLLATIQALDVEYAILSHREPFTREQFQTYLQSFSELEALVGDLDVHIQAHRKFQATYNRKPNADEFYILRGLVGGNIAKRERAEEM